MALYLDKDGLIKLVDNIKNYIDSKLSDNTDNSDISKIVNEILRITEFEDIPDNWYVINESDCTITFYSFDTDQITDEEFVLMFKDITAATYLYYNNYNFEFSTELHDTSYILHLYNGGMYIDNIFSIYFNSLTDSVYDKTGHYINDKGVTCKIY